jgi:hypothetical protein
MKKIKSFDQLFESESQDRIPLYNYLSKCITFRVDKNNHSQAVGLPVFPNYEANDIHDYRVNGVKTLDVILNTYFLWGSISYAFTQALNPEPNEKIMSCSPGLGSGSNVYKIRFIIGDSDENKFDYIGTDEAGERQIEVSGDNNYIFRFIIAQILLAFKEYGDRFYMTYAGLESRKLALPEYSNFIRKYLEYILKLKIGDPINYDVLEDIDNFFKKNPLDLYKIDNLEKFKTGVLERTGLKDYGIIGKKLRSGMI